MVQRGKERKNERSNKHARKRNKKSVVSEGMVGGMRFWKQTRRIVIEGGTWCVGP